jgi:hypothetical protein
MVKSKMPLDGRAGKEVPDMELIEDEGLSLGRTASNWPREESLDVHR